MKANQKPLKTSATLSYKAALGLIANFGSGCSSVEGRLTKHHWDFIIYKDSHGSLYERKSLWLDPQDRIVGVRKKQARRMSVVESFDLFREIILDEVGHCYQNNVLKSYLDLVASSLKRKVVAS